MLHLQSLWKSVHNIFHKHGEYRTGWLAQPGAYYPAYLQYFQQRRSHYHKQVSKNVPGVALQYELMVNMLTRYPLFEYQAYLANI